MSCNIPLSVEQKTKLNSFYNRIVYNLNFLFLHNECYTHGFYYNTIWSKNTWRWVLCLATVVKIIRKKLLVQKVGYCAHMLCVYVVFPKVSDGGWTFNTLLMGWCTIKANLIKLPSNCFALKWVDLTHS